MSTLSEVVVSPPQVSAVIRRAADQVSRLVIQTGAHLALWRDGNAGMIRPDQAPKQSSTTEARP